MRRGLPRPLRTAWLAPRAAGRGWIWLVERFNALGLSEQGILFGFAAVLGALGVVGFYAAIDLAYEWLYRLPGEFLSRADFLAYRPMLTASGLWIAWWIMRRLGRGHEGLNVPDVQLAVARRHGDIPTRPAVARTLASAVTLGAGGSAGSEGPVAVLGAAIGSFVGKAFRFHPSRVTVLVGAGTAAGISAAFNAPLAGAFFALEEILGSFAVVSFSPVVVASVIASVVVRAFYGNHPAFPVPMEYGFALQRELLVFYPLLGIVVGLVAVLFVRTYFATGSLVRRVPLPGWMLPLVGGLAVGGLVFLSRGQLVGFGPRERVVTPFASDRIHALERTAVYHDAATHPGAHATDPDSTGAESAYAEPAGADAARAESARAKSAGADAARTKSARPKSAGADAARTESARAESGTESSGAESRARARQSGACSATGRRRG